MARIGATVAIFEANTILLTLREDFEVWCMPGGELEEGEALADCARREAREETGLEVELTRLVGTYSRVGWLPIHSILFAARIIGGTLTPDPHEVLEARYFPFDALPDDDHMLIGQLHRIQDAINGLTGVVKTEYAATSDTTSLTRAEIYRLRDQSGLPPREFYRANVPRLTAEHIKVEVAGIKIH